eukprot:CAMPEP_0184309364 /NCGR_PEP_ID=MMETSP1049-20130417/17549_1 /TAXON_ID=77928 /ORGANISM="Proteomonas sulcata, Strain CCMP704" /LENGTH=220 /DNA_ID=CAMNT_0026622239 /DNA_START=225 /DNA_END=887 /DNA_ORIENTATION=+
MAKIEFDYQDGFTHKMKGNPKMYVPYVRGGGFFNGEYKGDSQLIIEGIMQNSEYDIDKWMSKQERALANAFRSMIEEEVYWPAAWVRFMTPEFERVTLPTYFLKSKKLPAALGYLIGYLSRSAQKKRQHQQGTGRLTVPEMKIKMHRALGSLSVFLGNNNYLMGSKVCSCDASIYGFLSLACQGDWRHEVTDVLLEYPNLTAYVERMRKEFWPEFQYIFF